MKLRPSKVSIRQPLVLYATLFMLLIAIVVLTVASLSMVRGARRAYRRATAERLQQLAEGRSVEDLRAIAAREAEQDLAIATATVTAFGLDLAALRPLAEEVAGQRNDLVVVRAPRLAETYLVARVSATTPTSIAFVEISRMVPFVLLGALACAGVLAFFIGRLLLPPLDALAEMAEDPRPVTSSDGLEQTGAPTEIHEVARRFRQTIRLLNEERDVVEAQRDELARMQESLVRASKLASVGRLAAGIAHEVGNPLAAVKGYLSIMRSGLEEPERSEVLERSVKELDRIHETIQKLLTYARRGESRREAKRAFELADVVEEVVTLLRGHPDLRGVEIEVDLPAALPTVHGHPARLNQVLVNLLLNAAHAMRQEPSPLVRVHAHVTDDAVCLEVEDRGPGIPEDQLELIFDPFFTTKEPGEGTGLGLAVSRALVEAMGGDLTVGNAEHGGACFVVRISTASSGLPD